MPAGAGAVTRGIATTHPRGAGPANALPPATPLEPRGGGWPTNDNCGWWGLPSTAKGAASAQITPITRTCNCVLYRGARFADIYPHPSSSDRSADTAILGQQVIRASDMSLYVLTDGASICLCTLSLSESLSRIVTRLPSLQAFIRLPPGE